MATLPSDAQALLSNPPVLRALLLQLLTALGSDSEGDLLFNLPLRDGGSDYLVYPPPPPAGYVAVVATPEGLRIRDSQGNWALEWRALPYQVAQVRFMQNFPSLSDFQQYVIGLTTNNPTYVPNPSWGLGLVNGTLVVIKPDMSVIGLDGATLLGAPDL